MPDVTEAEIATALKGNNVGAVAASNSTSDSASACDSASASDSASNSASNNTSDSASTSNSASSGNNVQTFTGALGGAAPPVIKDDSSDRPFSVNGATFVNSGAALQRSCAVQHNACASAANAGNTAFSVGDCGTQEDACNAAAAAKKSRRTVKYRRAALDFGDCANPAIEFAPQADRGNADAFAPVDTADFSHGSANAINVISTFICSQLGSSCKAAADAVSTCDDAAAAAKSLSGQAAADAFNSALGVSA